MAEVITLTDFRKPAEKSIPLGDIVELEKRNGKFYLQGAEVRVRLVGEHPGQTDSAKIFLENLAWQKHTPLGYTRDIETGAILVPFVEGKPSYRVRWYQILGENFI